MRYDDEDDKCPYCGGQVVIFNGVDTCMSCGTVEHNGETIYCPEDIEEAKYKNKNRV